MIYKKIKDAKAKNKAMLAEAAKNASAEAASETEAQIVQNKIQKASSLKMNAFQAAQDGAAGTGIDLNKKEDESSSPITYNSSALKRNGDGEGDGELVSYKGKKYTLEQLKKIKAAENNNPPELKAADGEYSEMTPGYKKFIDGLIGKGHTAQQLVDGRYLSQEGTNAFTFPGLSSSPGSETVSSNITPVMEDKTIRPSQRYNMGEKEVEDANTARGRMRRGLNREERKGMKDIVKGLDPTKRQEFRDNMKAQRNADRDGDGKTSFVEKLKNTFGGNRQQKKLNALNAIDGGSVKQEFGLKDKTIRQDIAKAAQGAYDFGDRANMSERDKKIEAASQSKYSFGLNNFGDFKAGSTTRFHANADGTERVVTDEDLKPKTTLLGQNNDTIDFSKYGMKDYASEFEKYSNKLLEKLPSFGGPTKKGKLGKNAKAFKNKSGRGAGY